MPLPKLLARWVAQERACEIDGHYLESDATPAQIAGIIVHEAVHARLHACGIPYDDRTAARVERLCFLSQRSFGERLPDPVVVEDADIGLALGPETWTPAAARKRTIATLRDLGTWPWLVRFYSWLTGRRAA